MSAPSLSSHHPQPLQDGDHIPLNHARHLAAALAYGTTLTAEGKVLKLTLLNQVGRPAFAIYILVYFIAERGELGPPTTRGTHPIQ